MFFSAAVAIIPLAGIMARATDELAKILGPYWGGLVNVSLGNATELIISIFALRAGLPAVVKAAITGSILSNILLVLGFSFLAVGLKNEKQEFDRDLATNNGTLLLLATISLFVPAIFYTTTPRIKEEVLGMLSTGVALVLFAVYIFNIYFLWLERREIKRDRGVGKEEWPLYKSLGLLLLVTVLIAWQSEILVSTLEGVEEKLGLSRLFIGVIIVPLIANAAENTTAVIMASRGNLELGLTIAIGSSTQVALFLVPLLIFVSRILGEPLNLLFNVQQVSALFAAVLIANLVYIQGRAHWMEGLQLIAAYLILALAFFFT